MVDRAAEATTVAQAPQRVLEVVAEAGASFKAVVQAKPVAQVAQGPVIPAARAILETAAGVVAVAAAVPVAPEALRAAAAVAKEPELAVEAVPAAQVVAAGHPGRVAAVVQAAAGALATSCEASAEAGDRSAFCLGHVVSE